MEIHSSSLTFLSIGYNRQSIDKNNNVQNKDEADELSVIKNSHNHQFDRGRSPDKIKKTFKNTGSSLDLINRHNTHASTDTRTLKAQNA
jgi:hypothetical protein